MKKITVINTGGNILSLVRAIEKTGNNCIVSKSSSDLKESTHIFLPGVGTFYNVIKRLKDLDLLDAIKSIDFNKVYLMGICVGMQILFERSSEGKFIQGLNLIKGDVVRINFNERKDFNLKIPNIGWHKINTISQNDNFDLLKNSLNSKFYFVHSFYAENFDEKYKIATINYGNNIINVAVNFKKIYGFQFHPEKSGNAGLEIIQKFIDLN